MTAPQADTRNDNLSVGVFLCYRRQDGYKYASQIYSILHGVTLEVGAGILDVDRLLRAPLPAKASKPKSRASAIAVVRRERFDGRVAELFPDIDPDRALHAVEGMFAMRSPRSKAAFARVDHEILFLLATTPALRADLRRQIDARSKRGAKSALPPAIATSQLLSSLMHR